MKRSIALILVLLSAVTLFSQTVVETADSLHREEKHQENYELLKRAVAVTSGPAEKAELLWRLSRATLGIGDMREREGAGEAELLAVYEEGESYADQAIAADPRNHWAYYMKSANMGRWGETKGILNSLFKARPMRDLLHEALKINPDHSDSFYVLGIMHERVPGWPLSFGDADAAVSFGRRAVDANAAEVASGHEEDIKLVYFLELARSLRARDWNVSKRNREQNKKNGRFDRESDVLRKYALYEGVVKIPELSDAEEAVQMMRWLVGEYEKQGSLTDGERADYEEAAEDLRSWTS